LFIFQIFGAIAAIPAIQNLLRPLGQRSLDVDSMTEMARVAMDAVEKFQTLYEDLNR
jgi:hypothetical protein